MTENKKVNEKAMCALAYVLFFIPLLVIPDSENGKFHANQGLTLFILALAVSIAGGILGWIPIIGWLLVTVGSILVVVLAINGIINALNEEQKELPIIGKYTFLK